jgi:hypothetical protein
MSDVYDDFYLTAGVERVRLTHGGQAQKRFHAALLEEKSALPTRRLLLEEAQRWQNHTRGSHETQSSRHRGKDQ